MDEPLTGIDESDLESLTDIFALPFTVQEWDDEANLSPAHLSYIINILLPKRLITLDRESNIESQLKEFCESKNIQNAVAVGSSSEGFNIPNSMTIETESHIDTNCDVDILLLEKEFQIKTPTNSLVCRRKQMCMQLWNPVTFTQATHEYVYTNTKITKTL